MFPLTVGILFPTQNGAVSIRNLDVSRTCRCFSPRNSCVFSFQIGRWDSLVSGRVRWPFMCKFMLISGIDPGETTDDWSNPLWYQPSGSYILKICTFLTSSCKLSCSLDLCICVLNGSTDIDLHIQVLDSSFWLSSLFPWSTVCIPTVGFHGLLVRYGQHPCFSTGSSHEPWKKPG